jgi:diacylglycerol kinase family enzyme
VKIALVLNSGAGGLRSSDTHAVATRIAGTFAAAGHEVETTLAHGGEAVAAIRAVVARGNAEVVIVGGGDGTISAAAAACAGSDVALGVLPLGTMNLFARALRVPLSIDRAAEALARGSVRQVDVARVNGRTFIHALTVGFHAALVEEREKTPTYRSRVEKIAGSVRSWWQVIRRPHRLVLSIRTDHRAMERQTIGLVVSNNVLGLGHLPYADVLDAGVLGLYVTTAETPAEIARVTAEAAVGLAAMSPLVEHLTSQAVDIRFGKRHIKATVDGELVRLAGPLSVESVAGALKVLAPAQH